MPYVAPSTVTTLQTYTSSAHNVIVGDIVDHESRIVAAPKIIETITLTGTGTIAFSNIPQTYTSLEVIVHARASVAAITTAAGLQFNGDTGTNYRFTRLQINNTSISGDTGVTNSSIEMFVFPGSTSTANVFGAARAIVPFYRSNRVKSSVGEGSSVTATAAECYHRHGSGYWNNTAAITSVAISVSLLSGSSATLIGIP